MTTLNQARVTRLAAHVLAENQARVGLPYGDRKIEKEYAIDNLPDAAEFDDVFSAVSNAWQGCTKRTLAELLTGVSFRDNCAGFVAFGAGQFDANLAEWGLAMRPAPKPAPTAEDLEIYDGTWEYPR